jgi:hypothetical protein
MVDEYAADNRMRCPWVIAAAVVKVKPNCGCLLIGVVLLVIFHHVFSGP